MIDATTTPKNKQTVTKQTVESNMYYSNYRQLISDLSMQQQIHNFKMMQKHLPQVKHQQQQRVLFKTNLKKYERIR